MAETAEMTGAEKMEKIVSLCKRKGFIFQSSEIYGGVNGAWDFGPLGVELKRNVKDYWWYCNVQKRDDVVGMDGAILMSRCVWKASGHEDTFSDPMVEDPVTNKRYRADQVAPQSGTVLGFTGLENTATDWKKEAPFSVLTMGSGDPEKCKKNARRTAVEFYTKGAPKMSSDELKLVGESESTVSDSIEYCAENGAKLGEPRQFNLMLKTFMGPVDSDDNMTYLRPETAQAIFVQFKNVLETSRKKLPFGIAQIGKSFRNEINPRNFIFRSREFEQMEIEFFVKPDQGLEWTDKWLEERLSWYEAVGLPREKIKILDVPDGDRAFYSKKTYDLEYTFPFGVQELEGIAYRTNYDLTQHQNASGKPLEYFDEQAKEKYIPHVVEPSAGVDRTVLAILCEAFDEETLTDDKGKTDVRSVLRFVPRMAPIKVGVFPLLKNKPELVAKAREVADLLRPQMNIFYDEAGAIGRRYRRMDEVGTPFGVTVDFETLEGTAEAAGDIAAGTMGTVTLRHRDSMKQERIAISDLLGYLLPKVV